MTQKIIALVKKLYSIHPVVRRSLLANVDSLSVEKQEELLGFLQQTEKKENEYLESANKKDKKLKKKINVLDKTYKGKDKVIQASKEKQKILLK